MQSVFFRLENQSDDYRATFLLLYLFVVMTEVVGRMQTSGGVGAGSVLSFPLAFVESRASHVACFCFSESPWGLRGLRVACRAAPGLVLSHVGTGAGLFFFCCFFCRDHQVLLLSGLFQNLFSCCPVFFHI